MLDLLIQNVKGLLLQPVETFENLKTSSLTDSYQHYVILLIIYTVLMGIVSMITTLMSYYDMLVHVASIPLIGSFMIAKIELFKPIFINWSFIIVYILFLFLLFGIFFKGFFLHVFVILFGGEQGVTKTIQVLMYATTPFFLLGWIPYISIIGLIWAVVLCVIGFQKFQNIPVWKAGAIIIVPTIFLIIGVFLTLMMRGAIISVLSGVLAV
ncbi:MAG: YIP1 family protein [Methanobacteriota archaeon]